MESYEDFIRTRLSRLLGKGSEQGREPPCRGSSVICFHGVPILPPLLTAESREEMLKHRTDAQGVVDRRNTSEMGRRMLHLRELLDSVQLRRAPTLREFLGDGALARACEGAESQRGCHGDPSPSRPLTSTARGDAPGAPGLAAEGDVSLWGGWGGRGERGERGGAPRGASEFLPAAETHGDFSHRSASSGYATHDNTEVAEGHAEVAGGHAEVTEGHAEVAEGHAEVAGGHAEVKKDHAEVVGGHAEVEDSYAGVAVGTGQNTGQSAGGLSRAGLSGAGLGGVGGPSRLSLQTLLERSQECRQRQRQLRSARAHSRSDKENQPGPGPLQRDRRERRTGLGRAAGGPVRTRGQGPARPRGLELGGRSSSEEGGSLWAVPAAHGVQRRELEGPSDEPPQVETPPAVPEATPSVTKAPPHNRAAPPTDTKATPTGRKTPPPTLEIPPPGLSDRFGFVPSPQFCTSPIHCRKTGRPPPRKLPVNTALSAGGGHRGRQSGATLTDAPPKEEEEAPASQRAVRAERASQPRPVPSLAQRRRVPDLFRKVPGAAGLQQAPVLPEGGNQDDPSAKRSYDVETPSALWPQGQGQGQGHGQGQGQDSRAKRRLLMNTTSQWGHRPQSSTPKGWVSVLCSQQAHTHTGPLQALQHKQELQLQEVLQRLSLQGVSVLGPSPSSGVRCVVTRSPLEPLPLEQPSEPRPLLQPCSSRCAPPAWRPLVAAAVRGFLTRRLLRTERLAQLQRTVKDSQQVLQALQAQTPGRGTLGGRQDLLLLERVLLQLRSARYEIHDVFFCLSPTERVQIISWDRQLLHERALKREEGGTQSRGRSLSAATVKTLERRKSVGSHRRAAERQRGPVGGACGGQARRHSEPRPTLSSRNR
ncbi:uncharacterized protein si:ch73-100l22.3 [Conger conger]|uniref:uncharacterized protein si:ch73-100l22.3 n=1 Tax=Conger conger TaxID=82655 RepID=UPI002A599075|nr:uncharacterized protein si:ch73-100l22.3 [Conger conger]